MMGKIIQMFQTTSEYYIINIICKDKYDSVLIIHTKYPLVMTNSLLLKITIEIVDFPIETDVFP